MQLYGREWTRRDLEARVGRLEQIGGLRRLALNEGPETGVEQIQVRTGGGLSFNVSPQRGMDISLVEFGGVPLSWQAPGGDVHPAYFDDKGLGFLRTAAGGLLMTCGLTQVGGPCEENGKSYGLHGRVHHLPARQVVAESRWRGDEYHMRIAGVVDETSMFDDQLRLTREIGCQLGENRLAMTDVVENVGFEPAPHMLLYHFNFGFPLVSEDSRFLFPSGKQIPRDEGTSLEGLDQWQAPQPGFQEIVYYHEDLITEEGTATARIENPAFPLGNGKATVPVALSLSWSTQHLPRFIQWKMPGTGHHVLGIEPANCYLNGRAVEREKGRLVMLEPGQSLTYELGIAVEVLD